MNKTVLKTNSFCGHDAANIYKDCCELFGFDISKAGAFAKQKPLFAAAATQEGYDIIFLAHSNRTHSKSGHVTNVIAGNNSWVTETWDDDPSVFGDVPPVNDRLVFAKDPNHSSGYIFIGHFRFDSHDEATHTSLFRQVKANYSGVRSAAA